MMVARAYKSHLKDGLDSNATLAAQNGMGSAEFMRMARMAFNDGKLWFHCVQEHI